MSSSKPTPKHIPAAAGGQPDAPNAAHPHDPDLVDGPPSTDEEVGLETTDGS